MTDIQMKTSNEVEAFSQSLLSTLDESLFFASLGEYLHQSMQVDQTLIFKVVGENEVQLMAENGNSIANNKIIQKKIEGPIGHIIRTKQAYFSNNVDRDPLFASEKKTGVLAELCIPIVIENLVLGTVHFKKLEAGREFSREDIELVNGILKELKIPLTNMKMYLAAKFLNDTLLKQIEIKEKELDERKNGIQIANDYKVKEREIIVESPTMKKLLDLVDRVSATDVHALMSGERGVGKEMVARRIHCRSKRGMGSFISIDCASFDEKQIEVELFGEDKGGFGKGDQDKVGLLERANGGTLFLNNINSISSQVQSKLAYFLNEKLMYKVGGQQPYRVDVRVLGGVVGQLDKDMLESGLSEDLYYCLNTMELMVPSLKERKEDIDALASHFLNKRRTKEAQKSLSPCVISAFKNYSWPGNVKELQNIVERAYILSDSMIIERSHLPEYIFNAKEEDHRQVKEIIDFTEMTLEELEKRHIISALDHLGGNKTKTARSLGITVKTLYNKLHSYGMINTSKEA